MKIVIEGPDNLGKSRLAEMLAQKYSARIIHATAPVSNDPKTEMLERAKTELLYAENYENIVFDRSCIGELVYAPMFRGYVPDQYYRNVVNSFISSIILVLLIGSCDEMKKKNIKRKNDELLDYQLANNCERISREFSIVCAALNPPRFISTSLEAFDSLDIRNEYIEKEVQQWV